MVMGWAEAYINVSSTLRQRYIYHLFQLMAQEFVFSSSYDIASEMDAYQSPKWYGWVRRGMGIARPHSVALEHYSSGEEYDQD